MEAHDLRLEFLDDGAGRFVEGRAVDGGHGFGRIDAELPVVAGEPRLPARVARRIGHGRRMREEVQVERLGRALADHRQILADLLRA